MELKKWISLILSVSMLVALAACAEEKKPPEVVPTDVVETKEPVDDKEPEVQQPETVIYTDSLGREVEVPAQITRIVPSAPLGQMYLYALCPEYFVGTADEWNEEFRAFMADSYPSLPVVGQLYGGKGELNLETLAMTEPQVIIDVGEAKKGTAEELDGLQEQLDIPCIHVSANMATAGDAFRELGRFLGLEERAEKLASFCENSYAEIQTLMEKVGEENKKSAMYCPGADGLNVIGKGSYHAEIIDMLVDNAAVLEKPSSKGIGDAVDSEQVLLWDPEVIFFSPEVDLEAVKTDPAWGQLRAIQNGDYHKAPEGPYNWMGFPPSVNRYLGMFWMASILYPDQVEFELYDKVAEYYELFYHVEMTPEYFDELTGQ